MLNFLKPDLQIGNGNGGLERNGDDLLYFSSIGKRVVLGKKGSVFFFQ